MPALQTSFPSWPRCRSCRSPLPRPGSRPAEAPGPQVWEMRCPAPPRPTVPTCPSPPESPTCRAPFQGRLPGGPAGLRAPSPYRRSSRPGWRRRRRGARGARPQRRAAAGRPTSRRWRRLGQHTGSQGRRGAGQKRPREGGRAGGAEPGGGGGGTGRRRGPAGSPGRRARAREEGRRRQSRVSVHSFFILFSRSIFRPGHITTLSPSLPGRPR